MGQQYLRRTPDVATSLHANTAGHKSHEEGHSWWLMGLNFAQLLTLITAFVFTMIYFFDIVRLNNFFVNAWATVLWQAMLFGITLICAVLALLMAPWSPVATFYNTGKAAHAHAHDQWSMRLFGINMAQWVFALAGLSVQIYVMNMGRVADFISDVDMYNLVWATAGGSFEDAYPIIFIHGSKVVLSVFSVCIMALAFMSPHSWFSLISHIRKCEPHSE